MAAGQRSGSFGDRSMDMGFSYFKTMLIIGVLFGVTTMLKLNHVIINAGGHLLHGLVQEAVKVSAIFQSPA